MSLGVIGQNITLLAVTGCIGLLYTFMIGFNPINTFTERLPLPATLRSGVIKYVTMDYRTQCNGRRLGNHMFNVAALLYTARLTGRRAILPERGFLPCLDELYSTFELPNIARLPISTVCPCHLFRERRPMRFDERIFNLTADPGVGVLQNISLDGYFQSWKYVKPVDEEIRSAFNFSNTIKQWATSFMSNARQAFALGNQVTVGVHVRRGDMVTSPRIAAPDGRFYVDAMAYFMRRFAQLHFIVCSDDRVWARENIATKFLSLPTRDTQSNRTSVNITYCNGPSAGHDLAVMSMCDHTIVSAGSYGWWAAWLANGTTVYWKKWPNDVLKNEGVFHAHDYYPTNWIPIGD